MAAITFDNVLKLVKSMTPVVNLRARAEDANSIETALEQVQIVLTRCNTYMEMLKDCDELMKLRIKFERWLNFMRNFTRVESIGDCWNDATICAEWLTMRGKKPTILAISGRHVAHIECVEIFDDALIAYHASPYNELPANGKPYSFWALELSDFSEWVLFWNDYIVTELGILDEMEYIICGPASSGADVRNHIKKYHSDYPNTVVLLELELIAARLDKSIREERVPLC